MASRESGSTGDTGLCTPELVGTGCSYNGALSDCDQDPGDEQGELMPGDGGIRGDGLCACATSSAPSTWFALCLVVFWLVRRLPIALATLLLVAPAYGQVDAQRFQIMDGGDFPTLWDADLGVKWSGAASFSVNAASNLAVLEGVPEAGVLLDRVWSWETHASVNLGGVSRLGFSIPFHAVTFQGDRIDGLKRGDIAVWWSIPLTQTEKKAKSAWTVKVDAPTGQRELLLGDVGVVTGLYSTGFSAGPFEGVLNLGAALQQNVALPGTVWGGHWVYGLGLRAEPAGPTWVTAELSGNAPVRFWGGEPARYPLEVLVSGGAVATRSISAGVGFGGGLTRGLGSSSFRFMAMLDVRPRVERDSDGDGIADLRDLCRRVPEDRDGFKDRDGCPEPDNDNDQILDLADECPNQAEVYNRFKDDDGCPDRITDVVVVIEQVRGLSQAEVRVGEADPVVVFAGETLRRRVDLDSVEVEVTAPDFHPSKVELELAGVPIRHEVRLEPIRYGTVRVLAVSEDGRPVAAQVAAGGGKPVPSGTPMKLPAGELPVRVEARGYLPRVVKLAVPANAAVDAEVTLRSTKITVVGSAVRLPERIRFALDEEGLEDEGLVVVDALAAWLRAHREVRLLRIEGHADPTGPSRYNYELSQRRAFAVRDALIAAGVAPERLDAIGTGEVRGTADDDADRRVEFVVLVWEEPDPPPTPPSKLR